MLQVLQFRLQGTQAPETSYRPEEQGQEEGLVKVLKEAHV